MKFSYNSSPSSASYTTTNYDDSVCQSKPTAGCIHGILRRFLCFNTSLPTHPSDHFNAKAAIPCRSVEDAESDIGEVSAATPGLVARLMGLDSMPMANHTDLNSVRRTKSMDSLRDVMLVERKHRHVKSTLSFRDAPAFLELEDEEFFILSFERRGKYKDSRSKPRKSDMGPSEMRTKRSEIKNGDKIKSRQCDKENQCHASDNFKHPRTVLCSIHNCHENSSSPENVTQQIKKPINKAETIGGRLRKKKKDQNCSPVKKVETECDSENTSPVSVLEFSEIPVEFEVPSAVNKARLTSSNSRRILFEELKNYNSTPSNSCRIINNDRKAKRDGDRGAEIWKRLINHGQNYSEMWEEGCNFAETEMKQTKWMYTGVLDNVEFDEINATFEFEILDQLLQELVDQVFFM